MSILDLAEKIKDWLVILFWPLFWGHLALITAFLGLISYEIGSKPGVAIASPVKAISRPATPGEDSSTPPTGDKSPREGLTKSTPVAASAALLGPIIASKNGTKYYPKGCSGIKRIKAENRISFASTKEAENAGYTKAKNCK